MNNLITIEDKNNILEIQFNKISLLSVFYLIFFSQTKNYNYHLISNEFYQGEFADDFDYKSIQKQIIELNEPDVISLANLCNLTLVINKNNLNQLCNDLNFLPFPEITQINNCLLNNFGLSLDKQKNNPIVELKDKKTENKDCVQIIDINPVIENKILFYYLFPQNSATIETVAEKVELLTMEQKDNILNNIFHNQSINNLPQIVKEKSFCVFKINKTLSEIQRIIQPEINLITNQLTNQYGFSTPESIIKNNKQENFLLLNKKTNQIFNNNPYLLNTSYRQSFILTLNLNTFHKLQEINTPLAKKIIELAQKEFYFLKNITD